MEKKVVHDEKFINKIFNTSFDVAEKTDSQEEFARIMFYGGIHSMLLAMEQFDDLIGGTDLKRNAEPAPDASNNKEK